MHHRWAALALVLALCAVSTKQAAGQRPDSLSRGRKPSGQLGQNWPNPVNTTTNIPFSITECGGGVRHTVSLRIYNVLAQLVAIPVMDGSNTPISRLKLACGDYTGRWNGKVNNTSRTATSGTYIYELTIDGSPQARKMFVGK